MKEKKNPIIEGRDKNRRKQWLFCYLMLIPAIWCVIRYFAVNGYSILIAFTDGEPFKDEFTARNFKMLFNELAQKDSIIYLAMINTFKYFLLGTVKVFIAFVVAYFLYKKIWCYKAFRFIFFLPSLIAPVVSIMIFKDIIAKYGPLWEIVKTVFKTEYEELLANPAIATRVIMIYMLLTGFGTTFLIFMGAMNRAPEECFEAARIDGCSLWREFWQILCPLTFETFSTMLLLQFATIFTATGPILYFTGGSYNTYTLSYWIFDQVRGSSYNYPSAVGMFFTLLAMPFVFGSRAIMKKINPEVSY